MSNYSCFCSFSSLLFLMLQCHIHVFVPNTCALDNTHGQQIFIPSFPTVFHNLFLLFLLLLHLPSFLPFHFHLLDFFFFLLLLFLLLIVSFLFFYLPVFFFLLFLLLHEQNYHLVVYSVHFCIENYNTLIERQRKI